MIVKMEVTMREVFRWAGAAMGALMLSAPVVCAQSGQGLCGRWRLDQDVV
jgi:hypothetical protein